MSRPTNIVFIWGQFGPYHIDRCTAVAKQVAGDGAVIGIELFAEIPTHLWKRPPAPTDFRLVSLSQDFNASRVKLLFLLLKALWRARPSICFLCHYERAEIFLTALVLRAFGVPVIMMQESKFDDKPRRLRRELFKSIACLPYRGVMVGGARTRSYMEFLGFKADQIVEGYDTASVERIRKLAELASSSQAVPYDDRYFIIIARLVEKKNLLMAIDAYARYAVRAGGKARELHICGDGPMRSAIEAGIARLSLSGVRLCGVVQPEEIPAKLAAALALILPSTEEQWGLVANEAIALDLPLLLSTNCGAADLLLRTGVNGFIFEPDNSAGLAYYMGLLGTDQTLWQAMRIESSRLRECADTRRFSAAAEDFTKRYRM